MQQVLCKFVVDGSYKSVNQDRDDKTSEFVYQVKARPVYRNEPGSGMNAVNENEIFGKYTPGGSLELYLKNDQAGEFFEPGAQYLVSFTKVED